MKKLIGLLGEKRLAALMDPKNIGKIRRFCDKRLMLPTEITLGGRTYEIVPLLDVQEDEIDQRTMLKRARGNSNLTEDDFEHVEEFMDEIPKVLRGEVVFIVIPTQIKPSKKIIGVQIMEWNYGDENENGFWGTVGKIWTDWNDKACVLRKK